MSKSVEQQARDMLQACGVEDAQNFTAGDVVPLANLINQLAATQIRRRTPEEAVLKVSMKAMALQGELNIALEREATWRRLANGYDDIRSWLRTCPDNPEGHAEFYKEACLIIFGHYQDESFNGARDEKTGETL